MTRAARTAPPTFALLALLAVFPCSHAQTPGPPLPVTEVAPGVYVHQGAHEEIAATNRGDIANIGFIVGTCCVAVIDTGGSVETGAALRRAIRAVTPLPVCYVINTHVHPDHILGNAAFRDDRPAYIAHHKFRRAIATRAEHYLNSVSRALDTPVTTADMVLPTRFLAEDSTLDLGDRTLVLRIHPTAHTDNDLTVFDTRTRTLWLSDLLFIDRVPALDGSIRGWLAELERLRATAAERVVPGHGPPSAPWPDALAPLERYLGAIMKETRQVIAANGTLEEAVAQVGQDERNGWILFDDYHRRNVTAAFAELEWED